MRGIGFLFFSWRDGLWVGLSTVITPNVFRRMKRISRSCFRRRGSPGRFEETVMPIASRLRFSKCRSHTLLRDFIFERDGYTCKQCCAVGERKYPFYTFSGRWNKKTFLVIDHILSLRNGGNHDPDNLQTLCHLCNCQKIWLEDHHANR